MESRAHAIVAVTFLVLFAAGIIVLVVWLNRGKPENRVYEIITTHSVHGLEPEAEVSFKGLTVGHVKQVEFDPQHPQRVRIVIGVHPDTPITHATFAQLNSPLVGGITSVQLKVAADKPQTPLPTSPAHPATLPMHSNLMQSIEHSGKHTLARIQDVLKRAQQVLSAKNQRHLTQLIARMDKASKQLVAVEQGIASAVSTLPRVEAEVEKTLAESRRSMRTISRVAAAARPPLEKASVAAESVTQASKSGMLLARELTEETLPRITTLTKRLNRTAADLDQLVRLLNRHPQSLLLGAPKPKAGPGEPGFAPPSVDAKP